MGWVVKWPGRPGLVGHRKHPKENEGRGGERRKGQQREFQAGSGG